jgi:hypothetical protein
MNLLRDVAERRAGAGIGASHAAIADASEQHCHHRDENGRDDVPAAALAQHSENRHRSHRRNSDNAVEQQVH